MNTPAAVRHEVLIRKAHDVLMEYMSVVSQAEETTKPDWSHVGDLARLVETLENGAFWREGE